MTYKKIFLSFDGIVLSYFDKILLFFVNNFQKKFDNCLVKIYSELWICNLQIGKGML